MSLNAIATSAFGRRAVTRAQIEAQLAVTQARACPDAPQGRPSGQGAIHKWTLLRTLGEIRDGLGVSDRTLGVLSALLSFHPETALTLDADAGQGSEDGARGAYAGLVVFPSNKALGLRCNGMSEPTLRRHLAALVEAGLIIRRDSPNGKRYARRVDEEVAQAFGFDLAPLVARAAEFEERLQAAQAAQRRLRVLKERVTLLRRDLSKRIAFALEEGLPGPWAGLRDAFARQSAPLRRLASLSALTSAVADLDRLAAEVAHALSAALERAPPKSKDSSGDADHFERRHTDSNPERIKRPEHVSQGAEVEASKLPGQAQAQKSAQARDLPLPLVLEVCRDVLDYRVGGEPIDSWRAFVDTARSVRPMLGVSPDAWRDAAQTLGEIEAAVAVAFILQRSEHSSEASSATGADGRVVTLVNGSPAIRSPGGYLRALTQKGREGAFPVWSALLAHLSQRGKAKGLRKVGEPRR